MPKFKSNTEEFVLRAQKAHGLRYNYDNVIYLGVDTPVEILCSLHGAFMQTPYSHCKGSGCRKCGIIAAADAKRMSSQEFKDRATQAHSGRYDYSLVTYKNLQEKVDILCPAHGVFSQRAGNHLLGHGCDSCAHDTTGDRCRLTTSEFIQRAISIHKDAYSYAQTVYECNMDKVSIICPRHGAFLQIPAHHLRGHGCPKCYRDRQGDSRRSTLVEFISKAQQVHFEGKYSYEASTYISNHENIEITCSLHGSFWQTPASHLQGRGCPLCRESRGERSIRQFLVTNGIRFETQKRFNTCRNMQQLPFDFYIPDARALIEYDGELHFMPVEQFGGEELLARTQLHDSIKTKWASDNGYELIRIPYIDQDRIPEILVATIPTLIIA